MEGIVPGQSGVGRSRIASPGLHRVRVAAGRCDHYEQVDHRREDGQRPVWKSNFGRTSVTNRLLDFHTGKDAMTCFCTAGFVCGIETISNQTRKEDGGTPASSAAKRTAFFIATTCTPSGSG